MSLVSVQLPDLTGNEKTYFTVKAAAAATALSVQNNQGFSANKYVVVGEPGTERAELRKISSVAGDGTITVDALKFDHAQGEPITLIYFNKAKIYGSATEAGSYSLIITVDLEVDTPSGTQYNDTTSGYDYYKISYYNSTSTLESDLSGAIPADGFDDTTLQEMTTDVLDMIGDPDAKFITREQVRKKINAHQGYWWFSPYTKRDTKRTRTYSTVAGQQYITLESDFDKFQNAYSVTYHYNPTAATDEDYCLEILTIPQFNEDFGDRTAVDSDELEACALYESGTTKQLLLGPTPDTTMTNAITIEMHIKPANLVNPEDKTICPHPRIITLGVAAEIVMNSDQAKADKYLAMQGKLQSGEIEHGRTKAGSTRFRFRRDYGKSRFRRRSRRRLRDEYDF